MAKKNKNNKNKLEPNFISKKTLNEYNYFTTDEKILNLLFKKIVLFKYDKDEVLSNSTLNNNFNALIKENLNSSNKQSIFSNEFLNYVKNELSELTQYPIKSIVWKYNKHQLDQKLVIFYDILDFKIEIEDYHFILNYIINKTQKNEKFLKDIIKNKEKVWINGFLSGKTRIIDVVHNYIYSLIDENKNWAKDLRYSDLIKRKYNSCSLFYEYNSYNRKAVIEDYEEDKYFNSGQKMFYIPKTTTRNLDEIFLNSHIKTVKFSGDLLKEYNNLIKPITILNSNNNKYFKPQDAVTYKKVTFKNDVLTVNSNYFVLIFNTKTKEINITKNKNLEDLESFVLNNNIEEKLDYLNSKNLRIVGKNIFENKEYNPNIVVTIDDKSKFFGFAFPDILLPLDNWKKEFDYILEHPNEEKDKYEFNYINSLLNSHYSNYKHKLLLLDLLKLIQSNSSNISKTGIINLIRGTKSSTYNYLKKPNNTYKNYSADFIENLILDLERKKVIDFYETKNAYKVIYNLYKFNERLKIEDFDCFNKSEEFKINQNILELINKKDLTIQDYLFVINNLKYSGIIARNFNDILDIFKNKPEQIETILKMKIKTESNKDIKTLLNKLLKSKN